MPDESVLVVSQIDFGSEATNTRFQREQLTAATFDANEVLATALTAAVAGITTGFVTKRTHGNLDIFIGTAPGEKNAQRENKWVVHYQDDVNGEKHRKEIGCADLTLLMERTPGSKGPDLLNLASVAGAAFKGAFEAFQREGENRDHEVTILYVEFVGRNL